MISSPIKTLLLAGTTLFLCAGLFAQNQVDDIVDRDPFDPNRGKEQVEEEEKVEEIVEVTPTNVEFQLDGTIIFPSRKMAIIKYKPDPSEMESPVAARVRNIAGRNQNPKTNVARRNKPIRRPRNIKSQMETKRLSENDKLQGYLVAKIESDHVVLTKGREQLTLRMFDGTKTNRGGSKKIAKPAPKKTTNRKNNKAKPVVKNNKKPLPVTKKGAPTNNANRSKNNNSRSKNNNVRRSGNNRKNTAQPVRRSVPKREF
ncbi:hypothetical protein [Acanthopleuribacter pedis]|uniref:Uncharacterized protein n=1 Tax=Acanthopleuribacter pedis TaxID=442870 RepID=A0A8J7U751_9BACT|nr:hypothetical protein [Acanthopleuribacter pedis]MBO1322634.1 hypothetical protein [Acanthopleuribacter pedis]